jgi:hypothetical protein
MADRIKAVDYDVRDCGVSEARSLIEKYHYAKGCSITRVYTHGMFRVADNELVGVAWWLPPTKPAAVSVCEDHWRRVLSLSRLVVHPDVPQNGASFLLGRSIRKIKKDNKWVALVTYADDGHGHTGAIYRATNWTYQGHRPASRNWVDPKTGRQVAVKSTKSRTKAEMLALGYVQTEPSRKHKFTMSLR